MLDKNRLFIITIGLIFSVVSVNFAQLRFGLPSAVQEKVEELEEKVEEESTVTAETSVAEVVCYTVIMSASMCGYADGGDELGDLSLSLSEVSPAYSIPQVEGPDTEGIFTVEIEPDTFYVRWLEGENNPIIEDGELTDLQNLQETLEVAELSANFFEIEGDFREVAAPGYAPELEGVSIVGNNPDFELELNTTGDITVTNGGILNGEWRSTFSGGGYAVAEAIDMEVSAEILSGGGRKYYISGGKGESETVLRNNTYISEVTFNSDGTGEGTITSQDYDYEADFWMNTKTGGGYYEDHTGRHEF